MKHINLKQISVDDLLTLRDRINVMLAGRVTRERHDLEARLKRLQAFEVARAAPPGGVVIANKKARNKAPKKAKQAKKVAAKYRNPENHAETWAGRGMQPRWMRAALNGGGKTLEDFRI